MSKPRWRKKGITKSEYWEWVKETATKNNNSPTDAEKRVIKWLTENKVKYIFQKPIKCLGGNNAYIADFVLPYNYILEVDGTSHNSMEAQMADIRRTKKLEKNGYSVLRIKNEDTIACCLNKTMCDIMSQVNNNDKNLYGKFSRIHRPVTAGK